MAQTNEQINIELNVLADKSNKSILDMRNEIKLLNEAMSRTQDPKEFDALSRRMGELKNDMVDFKDKMKYMDPGELLAGFSKLAQGAVGSFGAITGAMSLFGGESKKLQDLEKKGMTIIQILMSLESARQLLEGKGVMAGLAGQAKRLAGMAAVKLGLATEIVATEAATEATIVWNAALAANPAVAIALAVAALAVGVYALTKAFGDNNEKLEKNIELQKEENDAVKASTATHKQFYNEMLNEAGTLDVMKGKVTELNNMKAQFDREEKDRREDEKTRYTDAIIDINKRYDAEDKRISESNLSYEKKFDERAKNESNRRMVKSFEEQRYNQNIANIEKTYNYKRETETERHNKEERNRQIDYQTSLIQEKLKYQQTLNKIDADYIKRQAEAKEKEYKDDKSIQEEITTFNLEQDYFFIDRKQKTAEQLKELSDKQLEIDLHNQDVWFKARYDALVQGSRAEEFFNTHLEKIKAAGDYKNQEYLTKKIQEVENYYATLTDKTAEKEKAIAELQLKIAKENPSREKVLAIEEQMWKDKFKIAGEKVKAGYLEIEKIRLEMLKGIKPKDGPTVQDEYGNVFEFFNPNDTPEQAQERLTKYYINSDKAFQEYRKNREKELYDAYVVEMGYVDKTGKATLSFEEFKISGLERLEKQHQERILKIKSDAGVKSEKDKQKFDAEEALLQAQVEDSIKNNYETRLDVIRKTLALALKDEKLSEAEKKKLRQDAEKEEIQVMMDVNEAFKQIKYNELQFLDMYDKRAVELKKQQIDDETTQLKLAAKFAITNEQELQLALAKIDEDQQKKKDLLDKQRRQQFYNAEMDMLQKLTDASLEIYLNTNKTRMDEEKNRLDSQNDEEQTALEKRLSTGLITQKEYDDQIEALDKKKKAQDLEYRRKQFNYEQQSALIRATVETAIAVVKAYSQLGPLGGVFGASLAAAAGALQIAVIKSQSAPTFRYGGLFNGNSHENGGINANLEGGEVVLNKKSMSNPILRGLASKINVAGGGVPIPSLSNSKESGSMISAQIDPLMIDAIVEKIAAIPVIISERDITNTQRKVSTYETKSRIG